MSLDFIVALGNSRLASSTELRKWASTLQDPEHPRDGREHQVAWPRPAPI